MAPKCVRDSTFVHLQACERPQRAFHSLHGPTEQLQALARADKPLAPTKRKNVQPRN